MKQSKLPQVQVFGPWRVERVIGEPTHAYSEQKISLRQKTAAEEQRRRAREVLEADTFWRLRYRNQP